MARVFGGTGGKIIKLGGAIITGTVLLESSLYNGNKQETTTKTTINNEFVEENIMLIVHICIYFLYFYIFISV
jgi:hypothetical protein